MDSSQTGRVAILPIHPQYADAIIAGQKRVEFRRRVFRDVVEYVVIYVCNPIKKIIGFFRVSHLTPGTPSELWQTFQEVGGIAEEDFREYYKGYDQAVAIGIDDLVLLQDPITLTDLCSSLSAPQSFMYLKNELFEELRLRAAA